MGNGNGRTLLDLDEIDLRIIRLLQEDGRRSNSEIARQIEVSEPTIRKRIDRLIQQGTIKIAAVLNPRQSGYVANALVGIRAEVGKIRDVGEQLARLNEVVYVGYVTGRYDLVIEVLLHTEDEMFDWITCRLPAVSGIAITETFSILRMAKINYDWKLPDEWFERIRDVAIAAEGRDGRPGGPRQ